MAGRNKNSSDHKEGSMGGSQGTREERDTSPRSGSSNSRTGGYGSDSGYSDGERSSRDPDSPNRDRDTDPEEQRDASGARHSPPGRGGPSEPRDHDASSHTKESREAGGSEGRKNTPR